MAIPSGSGSEVLKTKSGLIRNTTTSILTVDALHIVTIISINLANEAASVLNDFEMMIHDGTADRWIIRKQNIPGNGTFVYSDKLVLQPAHVLKIKEADWANMSYWISYIDQDWS
tara:strand:- start:1648 stop:1992 length:345 start_codon:yes stop_codon:yes gene_type:complete